MTWNNQLKDIIFQDYAFPTEQHHTYSMSKSCHRLQHTSTCCSDGKKPSDEARWQLIPLSPIVKVQWCGCTSCSFTPSLQGAVFSRAGVCCCHTGEQADECRDTAWCSASWRLWLSALSPKGYYNPNMLCADRHVRQRNLSRAVVWDAVDNVTDVVEEIESRPAQCILMCSHLSLWYSRQNIDQKLSPGEHMNAHRCFSDDSVNLPSKSSSQWECFSHHMKCIHPPPPSKNKSCLPPSFV